MPEIELDVDEREKHKLLVRLAATAPDNWLVGELASSLHDRYRMTDQDICDELWSRFQKCYGRTTIVDARLTYGVFPNPELRNGWGFSHLLEASRAARTALGKDPTDEAVRLWVMESLKDLPSGSSVRRVAAQVRTEAANLKAGGPGKAGGPSKQRAPRVGTDESGGVQANLAFPEFTRTVADMELEFDQMLGAVPPEARVDLFVLILGRMLGPTAASDVRRDLLGALAQVLDFLTADEIEALVPSTDVRQ